MARGYNYAPGSSPEVDEARDPNLRKASIAMYGRSKNALVREIIAERTDCPFGLLISLAHDRVAEVRRAAARNPSAVRGVLEHLAQDKDPTVLIDLISNPALPEDVLEALALSKRAEVREAAAQRLDSSGLAVAPHYGYDDVATSEIRSRAVGDGAPSLYVVGDPAFVNRPTSPLIRTAPTREIKIPHES